MPLRLNIDLSKINMPKIDMSKIDMPKIDMNAVTRLTTQGRLKEAMGLLTGAFTQETKVADDATIEMVPPPPGTGQAWTAPGEAKNSRFESRTFTAAAGVRPYKLFVPSGYDGRPVPLIVMLHGCTQSPDDFAAGTRMNEVAEANTCLVAYPGQTQAANAQKCWNWFNSADQQRDQGEPALIAGITREVMRDLAVDPERVFVAGLSAGGAQAAIMGNTYPELYAAIGVHSGVACGAARDMPSAFAAMGTGSVRGAVNGRAKPVPTIVFHGDRDTTVHPLNGEHVITQSKGTARLESQVEAGRTPDGVAYTRTVQTGEDGRPVLEQWTVHGAGHAWSGGSRSGSYTDPKGPDASREMVRFFLARKNRV